MSLQEEIDKKSIEVQSESYSMSIGELINLYKDGELDIHPEFQRFFRWTSLQKTKLIESLLLKIPLPPIFVSQREDGTWDVVDGVQRLSTIFEFVGILRTEDNKEVEPLVLEGTKYLPSLENKKWNDPENSEDSFIDAQQRFIKRSKLDINIILRQSDEQSKYELFQRLNTGGSTLTPQEIRNCMLIMQNRDGFFWLRDLSRNEDFKECTALNDRLLEEQYDMELALRFVILRGIDFKDLKIKDINEFLTEKMQQFFSPFLNLDFEREAEVFKNTFKVLNETTKGDSFRKYDAQKNKFIGGFLISAFEVVALGIGYYEGHIPRSEFDIESSLKDLWRDPIFLRGSGGGINAATRIKRTLPIGREIFKPEKA